MRSDPILQKRGGRAHRRAERAGHRGQGISLAQDTHSARGQGWASYLCSQCCAMDLPEILSSFSFSILDSDQPPPPPTSATAGAAPDLSLLALRDGPDAFVDEDFCGARALYLDPASPPPGQPPPETVRWLRPAEVCAEAGWPAPALFVDSSSSSDVVQGRLGDCWFLSALAVVALQPRLLARLFRRWDDPPASAGRCTLVFHHDGAWRPVTIDDRLPCDADGQLLYARSATPHEMWVPLVEKAFAKLHGGYEALVSGFADAAMRQLTGGAPQRRLVTPGAGDEKLFHDNISPQISPDLPRSPHRRRRGRVRVALGRAAALVRRGITRRVRALARRGTAAGSTIFPKSSWLNFPWSIVNQKCECVTFVLLMNI